MATSDEIRDQIIASLDSFNAFAPFAGVPSAFVGQALDFIEGLTVGDFRNLVQQSLDTLRGIDFAPLRTSLNQFLDDPQFSGSLTAEARAIIEDLANGDLSFIEDAFAASLAFFAGIPASTLLINALDGSGSGGGGGGGSNALQLVIDDIRELVEGSNDGDRITVNNFVERILSGGGDDTIKGGQLEDLIKAGSGDDVIRGRAGDDNLSGQGGDDKMIGGGGDDRMKGGGGDDTMKGGGGADNMKGGGKGDRMIGGGDDDNMKGGGGDDTMIGGGGDDTLNGNGGADRFEFTRGSGDDVLNGYQQDVDMIRVKGGAFEELSFTQQGGDTLIRGDDFSVLVTNQTATDFDRGDFTF